MDKIDFKKTLKHLYNPPAKTVVEVVVPAMNFMMVDGKGDPNDQTIFQPRVEALYSVSYNLKFASKAQLGKDYTVMPLEGLWWVEGNLPVDPTTSDRSTWLWTLMVMQPDFITQAMFDTAVGEVRKKKNPALLEYCRFERYDEGRAAQTMHLGPFSDEKPTIDRVHAYIDEQGGRFSKKHHEIYLSDIRKTAPDKLRTVIRQPFG